MHVSTSQQYVLTWGVAEEYHWSYNNSLKEEAKAATCSDRRTISLIALTAKMVARILGRKLKGN